MHRNNAGIRMRSAVFFFKWKAPLDQICIIIQLLDKEEDKKWYLFPDY